MAQQEEPAGNTFDPNLTDEQLISQFSALTVTNKNHRSRAQQLELELQATVRDIGKVEASISRLKRRDARGCQELDRIQRKMASADYDAQDAQDRLKAVSSVSQRAARIQKKEEDEYNQLMINKAHAHSATKLAVDRQLRARVAVSTAERKLDEARALSQKRNREEQEERAKLVEAQEKVRQFEVKKATGPTVQEQAQADWIRERKQIKAQLRSARIELERLEEAQENHRRSHKSRTEQIAREEVLLANARWDEELRKDGLAEIARQRKSVESKLKALRLHLAERGINTNELEQSVPDQEPTMPRDPQPIGVTAGGPSDLDIPGLIPHSVSLAQSSSDSSDWTPPPKSVKAKHHPLRSSSIRIDHRAPPPRRNDSPIGRRPAAYANDDELKQKDSRHRPRQGAHDDANELKQNDSQSQQPQQQQAPIQLSQCRAVAKVKFERIANARATYRARNGRNKSYSFAPVDGCDFERQLACIHKVSEHGDFFLASPEACRFAAKLVMANVAERADRRNLMLHINDVDQSRVSIVGSVCEPEHQQHSYLLLEIHNGSWVSCIPRAEPRNGRMQNGGYEWHLIVDGRPQDVRAKMQCSIKGCPNEVAEPMMNPWPAVRQWRPYADLFKLEQTEYELVTKHFEKRKASGLNQQLPRNQRTNMSRWVGGVFITRQHFLRSRDWTDYHSDSSFRPWDDDSRSGSRYDND